MDYARIQIVISYEIFSCDEGVVVVLFVDEQVFSLLTFTDEEWRRLCN